MDFSLHSYVLEKLQEWKGRWSDVAAGSGVSVRTIEKIARQEIKDPGVSHIEKLAGFFSKQNAPARLFP